MSENIVKIMSDECFRKEIGRKSREEFENHRMYNIKEAWVDIFSICMNNVSSVREKEAFYSPRKVTKEDAAIEPMLLKAVGAGYDNVLLSSQDYKIGHLILWFPRKVKRFLRTMKGMICRNEQG
jgi:hypothetical protein